MLSVLASINNQNFVFCLIYIPPNSELELHNKIISYLKTLKDYNNVIVFGDLNLPDLDWDLYSGHSNISQAYADLAFDLNFIQLVSEPTHIGGNILDVILTNTDNIYGINVQSNLPVYLSSDHFIVSFYIDNSVTRSSKSSSQSKIIHNYSRADHTNC